MTDSIKFCAKCGKEAVPQGEYCQYCGAVIQQQLSRRKSKNTAVLLAVSLSSWTWLYTYTRDRWKFWPATGLGVISSGVISVYILKEIENAMNLVDQALAGSLNETQLAGSTSAWSSWAAMASIAIFGIWVWAVADTAIKRSEWYNSYYARGENSILNTKS